jgi:hypothetical protein
MPYIDNPFTLVRSKIKELLKAVVASGTTIYEDRETTSPSVPCIIMQVIGGPSEEFGLGEVLNDLVTKAHRLYFLVQFDCYADSSEEKDTLSNLLVHELWKSRHALKAKGVAYEGWSRIPADLPADQVGSRLFRSSGDCRFSVKITAAVE